MNCRVFEENRSNLKALFSKISNKDGLLSVPNLQIFCKNLNILPVFLIQGLITPVNLKRHVDKLIKGQSSRGTISFVQFEGLLKDICFSSFLSQAPNERSSSFFIYISDLSSSIYKTQFLVSHKQRKLSSDFLGKNTEEVNNSLDIDYTIKEALETLKTKDESFRSSHSSLYREISPAPGLKSRSSSKCSELRVASSVGNLRKPYGNKSVPDSPNTSILGARPSSRYHNHQVYKDNELDEFLQTERLVESENVRNKAGYSQNSGNKIILHSSRNSIQLTKAISVKKIEYTKSKNENGLAKRMSTGKALGSEGNFKKSITVRIEKESNVKSLLSPNATQNKRYEKPENQRKSQTFKKNSESLPASQITKPTGALLEKHRKFIIKDRSTLFSNDFVLSLVFSSWKNNWLRMKKSNLSNS